MDCHTDYLSAELLEPAKGGGDLMPLRAGLTQIVVAQAFDVPLSEMRKHSRGTPRAAFARQIAMYLVHFVFKMEIRAVAELFRRKATTVHHAIRKVEAMREEGGLDRTLGWLEALLRGAVR